MSSLSVNKGHDYQRFDHVPLSQANMLVIQDKNQSLLSLVRHVELMFNFHGIHVHEYVYCLPLLSTFYLSSNRIGYHILSIFLIGHDKKALI